MGNDDIDFDRLPLSEVLKLKRRLDYMGGGSSGNTPLAISIDESRNRWASNSSDKLFDVDKVARTDVPYITTDTNEALTNNRVLLGTVDQVIVTKSEGKNSYITLSTPQNIHSLATPTFSEVTLTSLTASRIMATNASKTTSSVTNLATWVAGTTSQITVTDDTDGTITLSLPQNIHTLANPFFSTVTLSSLTASRLVATNASKNTSSVANLTTWVAGTSNQITVADDGDGSITLSLPQSIHTLANPMFNNVTLTSLTASRLISASASKTLESTNLTSWIAGTTNRITVADDGDGSVTLNIASDFLANYVTGTSGRVTVTTIANGVIVNIASDYQTQPIFNANKVLGTTLSTVAPTDLQVLTYLATTSLATWSTPTVYETLGTASTHAALTTGVHGVGAGTIAKTADITAAAVGNGTAQWNANKILGVTLSTVAPVDTQVLTYVATTGLVTWSTPSAGGGSNATQLQGVNISSTAPANAQVPTYIASSSLIVWSTPSSATVNAQETSLFRLINNNLAPFNIVVGVCFWGIDMVGNLTPNDPENTGTGLFIINEVGKIVPSNDGFDDIYFELINGNIKLKAA